MGKIRYHQPCHLKAQNIGFKAQELMKLIPGAQVARMQCCSGHDGTWSVKKENFETSMKVGRPPLQIHEIRGRLPGDRLSPVRRPDSAGNRPEAGPSHRRDGPGLWVGSGGIDEATETTSSVWGL